MNLICARNGCDLGKSKQPMALSPVSDFLLGWGWLSWNLKGVEVAVGGWGEVRLVRSWARPEGGQEKVLNPSRPSTGLTRHPCFGFLVLVPKIQPWGKLRQGCPGFYTRVCTHIHTYMYQSSPRFYTQVHTQTRPLLSACASVQLWVELQVPALEAQVPGFSSV